MSAHWHDSHQRAHDSLNHLCARATPGNGARACQTPLSGTSVHRRAYEVSGRYILPHFKALSSLDNIIYPSVARPSQLHV